MKAPAPQPVRLSATAQRAMMPANVPSPDQREGAYQTLTFTYFTLPGGELDTLYTADVPWANVRLLLETAGPVAISTTQYFGPVTSGKGIILQTGVEVPLTISRGQRIYVLATNLNRVRVIVEPFAWKEQILGGIVRGLDGIIKLLAHIAKGGK